MYQVHRVVRDMGHSPQTNTIRHHNFPDRLEAVLNQVEADHFEVVDICMGAKDAIIITRSR